MAGFPRSARERIELRFAGDEAQEVRRPEGYDGNDDDADDLFCCPFVAANPADGVVDDGEDGKPGDGGVCDSHEVADWVGDLRCREANLGAGRHGHGQDGQ